MKRNCFIPPLAWAAFRYLRLRVYSFLQKNPLARGAKSMKFVDHYNVAKWIRQLSLCPPEKLREDGHGHNMWRTPFGDFWAPVGANSEFIARIALEICSDVYRYKGREGSIVLDCGANLGFFTRQALLRGAGLVVAFEPSPKTAECFRLTFAEEISSGRVRLIEKGVWDVPDHLFLCTHVGNPASDAISNPTSGKDGIYIDVTTIDAVCDDLKLAAVDFIKFDVEGAEVHALKGAASTIRRCHPAIGIGTEHGDDLFQNNLAVIRIVKGIDPAYQYICTDAHAVDTPSRGVIMCPHALYFSCNQPRN